jgi:beta-phosphoglucomutase
VTRHLPALRRKPAASDTLKAAILDLDGGVTDTAECHYLAWQRLADELNVPFNRERNEPLRGIGRMESLDLLLGAHGSKFSASERQKLAERKNGYYIELLKGITPGDLLPGIQKLLSELKAAGILVGLASASKNAPMALSRLGLSSTFDYVVDGGLVKQGKPHPEIFLRAASALMVEPASCVGIEDAVAGIQSVQGAGMCAVEVGVESRFPPCDLVVATTADLSLRALESAFSDSGSARYRLCSDSCCLTCSR